MRTYRPPDLVDYNKAMARIEELEAALRRLASPEAFLMPRTATEEERARMKYAEEALEKLEAKLDKNIYARWDANARIEELEAEIEFLNDKISEILREGRGE